MSIDSGIETVPREWLPSHISERPVVLSSREYKTVVKELRLPADYFSRGMKVLSVGEGLSDFARELHRKTRLDVIALDPIYALGRRVLEEDPGKVAKILREAYGREVELAQFQEESDKIPLPDRKRIVTGSVYELPFPDKSFDRVIGSRIGEHIDVNRAIPELVRVLKPEGGIRLSGILVSVIPSEEKLLPGRLEYDGYWGDYYFLPIKGIEEAMQFLAEKNLVVYVVLDELPRRSEVREGLEAYNAGIMIIRRDNQWPTTKPFYTEPENFAKKYGHLKKDLGGYPFLEQVMRVNTEKVIEEELWRGYWDKYYRISGL